jgi:hypothetical protein
MVRECAKVYVWDPLLGQWRHVYHAFGHGAHRLAQAYALRRMPAGQTTRILRCCLPSTRLERLQFRVHQRIGGHTRRILRLDRRRNQLWDLYYRIRFERTRLARR